MKRVDTTGKSRGGEKSPLSGMQRWLIAVLCAVMLCPTDAFAVMQLPEGEPADSTVYLDASLAHFDISPDLSMDIQPAMFVAPTDRKVSLGLNWAFTY